MRRRRVGTTQLREAWRACYAEHGGSLLGFARAIAPLEAEDALHDVVAHEVSKGRLPPERVEYLMRAIRNRISAIHRRRPQISGRDDRPSIQTDPPSLGGRITLDSLDETDRTIVVLRVQCGLSFPQIGVALGSPVGTVSSRYTRAIERLRGQFEEEGSCDERSVRVTVA